MHMMFNGPFAASRCVGDHRGDRQKFFPTSEVRFLTKEELQYIKQVVRHY